MIALIICLIGIIIALLIFVYSPKPLSKKSKGVLIGGGLLFCIGICLFISSFFTTYPNIDSALYKINGQAKNHVVIYGDESALSLSLNNDGKIMQFGFILSSDKWKIDKPYLGTTCIGKSYPIEDYVGFVTQIKGDDGVYIVLLGIDLSEENTTTIEDTNHSDFQRYTSGMHFIVATYVQEINEEYAIYINGKEIDITPLKNEMQRAIKYNYSQFYTLLLNGIFIAVVVVLVIRKMVKNKKKTTNS